MNVKYQKGGGAMKGVWSKTSAMIGMIGSLFVLFYLAKALLYTVAPGLFDDGSAIYEPHIDAFYSGLSALIISVISMIFYGIDAVVCVMKAFKKIHPIFNTILAVFIFVGFVFGVIVILSVLTNASVITWHIYYFAIIVLEIVSLIVHIKEEEPEIPEEL